MLKHTEEEDHPYYGQYVFIDEEQGILPQRTNAVNRTKPTVTIRYIMFHSFMSLFIFLLFVKLYT
jgi:hypothetical protein